jgi:2-C-methyl-D-erythritol 2,4-cyclodiphosphate synthase
VKLTFPEDFTQPARQVTGLGFDVHPFADGCRCVIGGVDIPFDKGLLGHSDADVLCHAVMDAILGALGQGDIGQRCPDSDARYLGASSVGLLAETWEDLRRTADIVNLDAVVIAEAPKIMPHAAEIRESIARALGCGPEQVSVKATTAERLGTLGRGEGIAAFCVATLAKRAG